VINRADDFAQHNSQRVKMEHKVVQQEKADDEQGKSNGDLIGHAHNVSEVSRKRETEVT